MIKTRKIAGKITAILCAVALCLGMCCIFAACSGDETGGTTAGQTKFRNVAYAENPTSYQYLDVYLPEEGEGPFPLVVFVHGGGWCGLTRSYGIFETMFQQLRADGYAVAYVDYTLSQIDLYGGLVETGYPQMLHDIKAAIRHLRANAGTYRVDPDNIVLIGESAGAHLSMLCQATDGNPDYEDLTMGNATVSSSVNGVITVGCPTFNDIEEEATITALETLFGDDYTQEDMEGASPYFQVTDAMCPVFMSHCTGDDTIPCANTKVFAEKLAGLIGEENVTTWYPEEDAHVDKTIFNSGEYIAKVEAFLETVVS